MWKKPHVPDDFSRLWGCDFDPWKRFWSCESVESGHDSMMIQIVITDSRIFSIMNIYILYILYIYIIYIYYIYFIYISVIWSGFFVRIWIYTWISLARHAASLLRSAKIGPGTAAGLKCRASSNNLSEWSSHHHEWDPIYHNIYILLIYIYIIDYYIYIHM